MSQAQMKTLHRKRSNVKNRLSLLKSFSDEIATFITPGEELSVEKLDVIRSRLKNVEEINNTFNTLQGQIEETCKEENLNEEYAERERFETKYHTVVSKLNRILLNATENKITKEENTLNSSISQNLENHIKLPVINLPKFNGAYTDWLEFKEIFQSLIHANSGISQVQKFHYLRASLGGSAAKAIQKPNLSSDSYDIVWESLCARYDNNDILIHEHIKAIFDLQTTTSHDSKGFRNMIDELNKHLKYLSKLGNSEDQKNALLIYILTSKFDKNSLKDWEEFTKINNGTSMENLERFLTDKAEILEKLEQRSGKSVTNLQGTSNQRRQNLLATELQNCKVCKSNHSISMPRIFKIKPATTIRKNKIFKIM